MSMHGSNWPTAAAEQEVGTLISHSRSTSGYYRQCCECGGRSTTQRTEAGARTAPIIHEQECSVNAAARATAQPRPAR